MLPSHVHVSLIPAPPKSRVYAGTQAPQTVADGHGIWFSDQQGISLYTTKGELRTVSPTVADLAGACR